MAWIESHQSLGRHPKTKATARSLGITRVQLVGHLQYLWWWALDFAEDGDLSAIDPADIAEEAMWEGDPEAFIDGLVQGGFLTESLQINDWEDYTGRIISQREKNRERQRRFRERKRDDDVTGTPPNDDVTVTQRERNRATQPNRTVPNQTEQGSASDAAPVPLKPRPKKQRPVNGPAQKIIDAYCEAVGIDQPTSWDKAGGQAKTLHNAGVKPEDIPKAVAWCRSQKWLEDGFDLGTIVSQADKWRPVVAKGGGSGAESPNLDYFGTDGLKRRAEEYRRQQAGGEA